MSHSHGDDKKPDPKEVEAARRLYDLFGKSNPAKEAEAHAEQQVEAKKARDETVDLLVDIVSKKLAEPLSNNDEKIFKEKQNALRHAKGEKKTETFVTLDAYVEIGEILAKDFKKLDKKNQNTIIAAFKVFNSRLDEKTPVSIPVRQMLKETYKSVGLSADLSEYIPTIKPR